MPTFEYDEDHVKGFKTAVRNGQVRLALEYAERFLGSLVTRLEEAEQHLEDLLKKADPKPSARTKKTEDDGGSADV